jgi:hypothetical protein
MIDLATVTRDAFEVGSTFTIQVSADSSLSLELIAIESLPTAPNARRQSFLLRFRTSERARIPQRIYGLDHPALGRMDVFLVPVGPDQVGMRYDAVFG